jgi:hypothetical protein
MFSRCYFRGITRGRSLFVSLVVKYVNSFDAKKTRFLALFLFFFFTGVVVSPVSSVVPSETSKSSAIERRNTRPDIYMLDLVLWKVLTNGRHSDYVKCLSSLARGKSTAKEVVTTTSGEATENPICPLMVSKTNRPVVTDCVSANPATRSACSDLSPPLLS